MTNLLMTMCPACQRDWHQFPTWACPGSLATDDEIAEFNSVQVDFDDLKPKNLRVQTYPRIRFWASDFLGNGLRLIEGTLRVGQIDMVQRHGLTEYTVTGQLMPPVVQALVPDEIGFDADSAGHELLPVVPVEDDLIHSEIAFGTEGFLPVGTIDPDSLKIESKADYEVRAWGGQTVKTVQTRQETTVEFSTCTVDPSVMERLWGL